MTQPSEATPKPALPLSKKSAIRLSSGSSDRRAFDALCARSSDRGFFPRGAAAREPCATPKRNNPSRHYRGSQKPAPPARRLWRPRARGVPLHRYISTRAREVWLRRHPAVGVGRAREFAAHARAHAGSERLSWRSPFIVVALAI